MSELMTEQEELEYEMQPEYDFYEKFPSSEAVNEALRSYLKMKETEAA